MKKVLLSVALLAGVLTSNAQEVLFEQFNSFTTGNLSESLDGTALGQNNWGIFGNASTGAALSNYQIIEVGTGDNAVLFQGSDVAVAASGQPSTTRYIYTSLANTWGARDAANNVVRMSVNFNTGAATASHNQVNICFFDSTNKIAFGFRYFKQTNTLTGTYYFSGTGGAGTYYVDLGAIPTGGGAPAKLTLKDDNWYNLLAFYDKTSGKITWYGQGYQDTAVSFGLAVTGTTALDIDEFDFYINSGSSTNAAAQEVLFDDVAIMAVANDKDLNVASNNLEASNVSVSPNPANDFVKVAATNALVNSISLTDLNGRTVKTLNVNNVSSTEVNVSDLASGVYMMNIKSDKGTTTKKFIKN